MLLAAGGLSTPGQPRAVRARSHGLPQGLADRPAASRRRRSSATRCATRCSRRSCARWPACCPIASPPAGTSSCAPRSSAIDPRTGRPSVCADDLPARRPGRDARRRRLRRARVHRDAGQHALARHGDVRALDAPPGALLRVPARLGGPRRVARRATARARAGRSTASSETGTTIGDDVAAEGADPAEGLFGGGPGGLNELHLRFPDGSTREWGSKEIIEQIPPGTVCESVNGGGGGYGDARRRDPRARARRGARRPAVARGRRARLRRRSLTADGRTVDEAADGATAGAAA